MQLTALHLQANVTFGAARKPYSKFANSRPRHVMRSDSSDKASVPAEATEQEAPKDVCKACGAKLNEMPRGCDGQGRLLGGIGSVPGFGWWPIKAYRECPTGAKRGVQYRRKGQITDEVLFGRGQQ